MRIPSGVTDQYIYFVAVDSTDFTSRETGLSSFTVYRSRNGAAAAAMTTPTVNETDATNMPGVYELLLDEDMTIDAGDDSQEMVFHITATGMAPVTRVIELYRPKITAGNTLDVTSTGAAGIDWGNVENQSTSVDLSATSINLTDTATTVTNQLTAATIADAVLDEALAGHTTAGTLGKAVADIEADTNELQGDWANGGRLDLILDARASQTTADAIETDTQDIQSRLPASLVSGRMSSDVVALSGNTTAADNLEASALGIVTGACEGTPSTTVIQTDLAETTDDHYIGRVIIFTSGNAAGEATDITDYTGSTGTVTVTALTTAPSASDTFVIV